MQFPLRIPVTITLIKPLLGTAAADPEIYKKYLESNRPEGAIPDQETATLPSVDEEMKKSGTVFHRVPGSAQPGVLYSGDPMIYDYQLKGFFKDTCSALGRVAAMESAKLRAFKKIIDSLIFVYPRHIKLQTPPLSATLFADTPLIQPQTGSAIGICTRPLRAQTAQGERVTLARSEAVPTGTVLKFEICLLDGDLEGVIHEWMGYGELRGLGQWRNSGMGQFTWTRDDNVKAATKHLKAKAAKVAKDDEAAA